MFYSREIKDLGLLKCRRMYAFYALEKLTIVLKIFPDHEFDLITDESSREEIIDKNYALNYLTSKADFITDDLIDYLFLHSELTLNDVPVTSETFSDVDFLFFALAWVVEVSYSEALARPSLEMPSRIQNADKILKSHQAKIRSESQTSGDMTPIREVNGVLPKYINPWLFTLVSTVSREKRIDWQLFFQLKTTLDLVDFIDLWQMTESAKSYETAELLNSLD